MDRERKVDAGSGLFTMSRVGPDTLTHKSVEDYLSMGRRMQSVYAWELAHRLGLWLRAILTRSAGWFGALSEQKRGRCIRIQINRKSPC